MPISSCVVYGRLHSDRGCLGHNAENICQIILYRKSSDPCVTSPHPATNSGMKEGLSPFRDRRTLGAEKLSCLFHSSGSLTSKMCTSHRMALFWSYGHWAGENAIYIPIISLKKRHFNVQEWGMQFIPRNGSLTWNKLFYEKLWILFLFFYFAKDREEHGHRPVWNEELAVRSHSRENLRQWVAEPGDTQAHQLQVVLLLCLFGLSLLGLCIPSFLQSHCCSLSQEFTSSLRMNSFIQ